MRKGWDDDYKTCACAWLVADGVPFFCFFLLPLLLSLLGVLFLSLLFLGWVLMFGILVLDPSPSESGLNTLGIDRST